MCAYAEQTVRFLGQVSTWLTRACAVDYALTRCMHREACSIDLAYSSCMRLHLDRLLTAGQRALLCSVVWNPRYCETQKCGGLIFVFGPANQHVMFGGAPAGTQSARRVHTGRALLRCA